MRLSCGAWTDCPQRLDLVDRALARESWLAPRLGRAPRTTREEVFAALAQGEEVHFDSDWYAVLRDADAERPQPRPAPRMVACECGHTVRAELVMTSSSGTCCPDCYDERSW